MTNIFALILLIFSAMQVLKGDKRLLISDPQYAQNIVQAFDVKLEKLNQHVVQQDNIISSLQNNITVQEAITRHQFNETSLRLEDSNLRLQLQETKYQQTVQKLEAQNTKLTQDLDKNKELNQHLILQNQQFSNDTKELTSQLSALNNTVTQLSSKEMILNNTVTQLSSKETILSQQLLNQSNQLNHLQTLASMSQPAFHVALRTPIGTPVAVIVPHGGKVVFQTKLLDIGNGYNTQTGIYTVVRSGTYVITWTISVHGQYVCFTRLMVNNADKGAIVTDDRDAGSYDEVSTTTVVLPLVVGDQLYIKQYGSILCRLYQNLDRQTSFSGWFLHE